MIELTKQVIPYRQHIRNLVEAETVYCSDWIKPIKFETPKKPRPLMPLFWGFLLGILIASYVVII